MLKDNTMHKRLSAQLKYKCSTIDNRMHVLAMNMHCPYMVNGIDIYISALEKKKIEVNDFIVIA